MYIPQVYKPTIKEEQEATPVTGFADYIEAGVWNTLAESKIGGDLALNAQVEAEEIKRYGWQTADNLSTVNLAINKLNLGKAPEPVILTREEFYKHKDYVDGMEYQDGMTEARMNVYARWRERQKERENVVEYRNAGFFDGALGFAANMVASVPGDPTNLVSFGIAGSLAKKIGFGIVENITGETIGNLVTYRQRQKAGIAATTEEILMETAFAAAAGAVFPVIGTLAKGATNKTKMKIDSLKTNKNGMLETTVEDAPVVPVNLAEKSLQRLSYEDKVTIMQRMHESANKVGEFRIRPISKEELIAGKEEHASGPEQLVRDVFGNDPFLHQRFIDSTGAQADAKHLDTALNAKAELNEILSDQPDIIREMEDFLQKTEEERAAITDDMNISLDSLDEQTRAENDLLQGKRLFENADERTRNFSAGIDEAIELANNMDCR